MTRKLSLFVLLLGLTIPLAWLFMGNAICTDDLACRYEALYNYMAGTAVVGSLFFLLTINIQRRSLDRVAVRDRESGLYSRHHFFDLLRGEYDRAIRHGQDFTVMTFCFENMDTQASTKRGRRALRRFFAALASSVRSSDVLARTDRNEYAMILPGTDADGGRALAGRLNALTTKMLTNNGPGSRDRHPLTVGLANWNAATPKSAMDMYTYSRKALAQAQDSPRNKVMAFAPRSIN